MLIIVVLSLICILLGYSLIKTWCKFQNWKRTEEQRLGIVRKTSIGQSRAVLGGKFVEQMAPYLPEFKYDPTEARFIGSPIDLVVFPGLANGNPEEIVIMEIKTSKNYQLTPQQQKIRQLIESGMVRWELIEHPEIQKEG